MRNHIAYERRGRGPSGPESLDLGDGLAARRIATGTSRTLQGAATETWVVHPHGGPGEPVLQADLYKEVGRPWTAWTGSFTRARDRELAQRVATARNGGAGAVSESPLVESPAADRRRWDELHAAYAVARTEADAFRLQLNRKYGSDSNPGWRTWLPKGDRDKLERLEAKVNRVGDKIVDLLVRISPRGESWLSGVPVWWLRERLTWEDAVRPADEPLSVEVPLAWGATHRMTESSCTCAAEPHRHAVHAPQRQAKSRLDLILDRVKAGEREVTIDTEGYTRDQVNRVIAAAKARGLSASFDGRVVLIRDLGAMQESTRAPGLQVAVKAMRLYLGSVDYASVPTQQRLYDKASRAVQRVATATGMLVENVWGQVQSEARRQGAIRPVPGQHF